jgi:WD40 repeat protein
MKLNLPSPTNRNGLVIAAMFALAHSAQSQQTPQIVWSTNAHSYLVGAMSFSKDGAFLASGAFGTGHVWRVSNRSLVNSFSILDDEGSSGATSFAFSPDNSLFAMGDGMGRFRIWRLPSAALVFASVYGINYTSIDALCFSPDGSLFAYAGFSPGVHISMTPDGSIPFLYTLPNFPYPEDGPVSRDIRLSPDGQCLAVGFSDNSARLYRMAEGYPQLDLTGHSDQVVTVDFSPDGKLLVTSSFDGDARVWRVPQGDLVRIIPGGGDGSRGSLGGAYNPRAIFSADGKSLLTFRSGSIRFWSVADGRLLLTYPELNAFSMSVSPDGQHFAYGTGSLTSPTGTVVLARMPLLITDISRANGQLILGWSGGSGRYQLQSATNLATGPWQNVGEPTTATAATNSVAGTLFYRVQSLPIP